MRALKALLLAWILLALPFAAQAQNIKIFVNSGTGFIISRSGYVITNLHVVDYCNRITVHGAQVSGRLGKVIGRDVTHDLALIKIDGGGLDAGMFRDGRLQVIKGERVAIVGYPRDSYKRMQTVSREAVVIDPKGPNGNDNWLQISDMIEQGNSGGPLLDASGNIIGVIVAKAVIYTYKKSEPEQGTYTNSGVAIATPVVKKFLDAYNVPYASSDAASELSLDRLTDKAHGFVVNVLCETPTEVR